MQSLVIPLVKNKSGDLSDINNYRAIALYPVISKIFENVIGKFLRTDTSAENHQFGFKAHHLTSLCTNVLKEMVAYYTGRGSYVFASFIGFQNGADENIVRIFAFWYTEQTCYVKWKDVVSSGFRMGNGTRQGVFCLHCYSKDT